MRTHVKKKHIAFWLSVSVCLSMFCLPLHSVAAQTESADAENNMQTTQIFGDTYENYRQDHGDKADASAPVTIAVDQTVDSEQVEFVAEIPADGMYTVGMTYRATGDAIDELQVALMIDGKAPFSEAEELLFPRFWQNDGEGTRTDGLGNEFAAKQIAYNDVRSSLALDISKSTADPYRVYLTAGTHKVALRPVSGSFYLESFTFGVREQTAPYQKPSLDKAQKQDTVVLEGEGAFLKNSYWLAGKSDNASVKVTPHDPAKTLVNYIGGENWKAPGETIVWRTPEMTAGYYQLGFSFRQSYLIGGKTYRALTIDGTVPFSEANTVSFSYNDDWQQSIFADETGTPYLIYLSAGVHEIALTVVPGEIDEVRSLLNKAVSEIGSLYIDITMITGETPDTYRDYDLFSQIGDMEQRLTEIDGWLEEATAKLRELSGQSSGSDQAVVRNMMRVISQMLNDRYSAHRYKSEFYTRYTALAATLYDMQNMPLDIDKIVLTAPGDNDALENAGFWESCIFSFRRFFLSFVNDYNGISSFDEDEQPVTVWVNWGRDQAQVLSSLAQSTFTARNGTPVNIQLVNASIVQATLSGKGPDVILQHTRSEPVNLAMRGVLYDLKQFYDLDEVLARFQDGADVPYRYKDGLYALPDTQLFFLMFYRTDVLDELGLSVPETWDDFKEIAKLLARRNLQVWLPNDPATNVAQTNAGIGSINIFPSLVLQKGLSLYAEDGRSTALTSADVMIAFSEWTDLYRKFKIPKTLDFYNRFRTGVCPIGVATYTLYTTLKAAAPEIDGLWSVAPIPGTMQEDGTVSHISSGGGTACAILKATKDPAKAWEFLKWWTSADTQVAFSNELEAVLGPTGRLAPANKEAFCSLSWDKEMLGQILKAWEQVKEIPEYPGSYYVSRSVYQSFWNVVDANRNPKDMLLKYGKQADEEIRRKWEQYENR